MDMLTNCSWYIHNHIRCVISFWFVHFRSQIWSDTLTKLNRNRCHFKKCWWQKLSTAHAWNVRRLRAGKSAIPEKNGVGGGVVVGHRLELCLTPLPPKLKYVMLPCPPPFLVSYECDISFIMYFVITPNANKMIIHTDQVMISKPRTLFLWELAMLDRLLTPAYRESNGYVNKLFLIHS